MMLIFLLFVLIPWVALGLFAILTSAVPLLMLFAFLAHGAISVGLYRGLTRDLRFADGFSVCNTCIPDVAEALVHALEQSAISAKIHAERIAKLRAQIHKTCKHPKEHVGEYEWEHDNGYGRQHMMTGWWCKLCLKKNPYGNHGSLWYDDSQLRKRSDY